MTKYTERIDVHYVLPLLFLPIFDDFKTKSLKL